MINKIKIFIICSIYFLLANTYIFAQSSGWVITPGSPFCYGGFWDLFFLNANTGWVINIEGPVFKTTNGGNNWTQTDTIFPMASLQNITFLNENTGWLTARNPARPLFKTTNSGFNWTPITNIPPPADHGFYGISLIGDSNIYLVGSEIAPSYFTRSTNAGATWQTINLGVHATALFDCKFFTKDSGIASGSIGVFPYEAICVVLFTSDGGVSWRNVFTGNRRKTFGLKLNFINRYVGYLAIESFSPPVDYLKTTNGGLNWEVKYLRTSPGLTYEAIGFIDENTGWIGGNTDSTFRTTDGGNSWAYAGFGKNIQNFLFVSDSAGYAAGQYIYKYDRTVDVKHISVNVPDVYFVGQNYPNPFNPQTSIKIEMIKPMDLTVKVFDNLGREAGVLHKGILPAGTSILKWNAEGFPSGVYYYNVEGKDFKFTKKMSLVK
ncbi:MAG: T9SS type A sorting domain-containing protein [Ignavibacteria bacterium]|nr:T9SS type A sorting domain-containing protein [Ignavibacteria bacterium]